MANTGDPFAAMQKAAGAAADAEYKQNLNQILICPECKEDPPNLVEEFSAGDTVCASCGMVLGDRIIDTRSEWRTFANDDQGNDDPSRVGDAVNPLLNGSQLETSIAFNGDSRSRDLHRAQNRNPNDKAAKSLLAAYREISQFCDAVNIPKTVQDSAKHIFKLTDDAKLFKGKAQEPAIAGCIFIACRQAQVPRTFREIYALTKVSKKEIGRTFKALEKFLQTKNNEMGVPGIAQKIDSFDGTNSTNATQLCARYCSELGFINAYGMERSSIELAERATSLTDLAGRSPLSVAAACIYMVSHLFGDARSSKKIADVAGVSDGTIKTAYRFLYQSRNTLIDPVWLKKEKGGKMDRLPAN